jgi:hypothetical protein
MKTSQIQLQQRRLAVFVALVCLLTTFPAGINGALLDPVPYGKSFVGDMPKPSETRFVPRDNFSSTPLVRVGYVIPTNRVAQAHAIPTLQAQILVWRDWFCDQMTQAGFPAKTFRYETEADGITPLIHVVRVPETDDYIREDVWGRTMTAAANAGLTLWAEGEVWLLIPETHLDSSDGSVTGSVFLGASYGSGIDPGLAMVGSDALARMRSQYFTNDSPYDGAIIPEIGAFPLKQDVSFPWFEGKTFSSISSSARGGALHELGHALGLGHDFKNDDNFRGSIMGNGLRGFRGVLYPARYSGDYSRLSLAHAIAANTSRYFNSNQADFAKPSVNMVTESPVTVTNGLLQVHFNGFDVGGFAWAWLVVNGDLVDEMPLSGPAVDATFATYLWTADSTYEYEVVVSDTEGNRSSVKRVLHVVGYDARSPWPAVIRVAPQIAFVNESVTLDGNGIYDLVGGEPLWIEWDLNGDGIFDTPPSTSKFFTTNFLTTGARLIRARATGPGGVQALSTPVPLNPHRPVLSILRLADHTGALLSWDSRLGIAYERQLSADLLAWMESGLMPQPGNGTVIQLPILFSGSANMLNAFRLQMEKQTCPLLPAGGSARQNFYEKP